VRYRILILRRAQKELADLPHLVYDRVKQSILDLASNPRPGQTHKLVSRDGWRIRVGDYRVIYEIDDTEKTVTVLHVGHRRDVYG
jgi:mRNA interferase RelE/StbE